MPHFDSAGRHADDYDVHSMWIGCRHDPDSRTMVQYDPYTDRWHLYGIYDIDYPTPEEVIVAAKRLTAAGRRYRRRGGPPDQDPIPVRESTTPPSGSSMPPPCRTPPQRSPSAPRYGKPGWPWNRRWNKRKTATGPRSSGWNAPTRVTASIPPRKPNKYAKTISGPNPRCAKPSST